jgi:predicted permease
MTTLRSALRSFRHAPGFMVVAVVTLAVCIASSATIFAVYDRLVLEAVSVPNPQSLVAIWSNNPQINFFAPAVSWTRFREMRRGMPVFSHLGVSAFDSVTLTAPGQTPLQLNGLRVSGEFFQALGVPPTRGRDFTAAEDVPNGPAVCILSHEFWTTRFGARETVLGEVINLNGQPWQVVGIMPPSLTTPFTQVQVFLPRIFELANLTPQQIEYGAGFSQPIARLAPGVSIDQAKSALAAFNDTYRTQYGNKLDAANDSVPRDFTDSIVGTLKPTFYTLIGAVAFVLLIACANVASLFVARLNGRQKEIAVRQSLGATRATIVRELLTESLLIALGAAALAVFLARWALAGVGVLAAGQLPPNTTFALTSHALLFILATAGVVALLVGLLPGIHASAADVVTVLKDATRGSTGSRGGRLRSGLIIVEVALSVVLLVGSSLLLISFLSLSRTPPGFEPNGLATAFVGVPAGRYQTPPEQAEFFSRVVDTLRRDPTIGHATASLGLPVPGFGIQSPYTVAGHPILPLAQRPLALFNVVTEDYFATLRVPVLRGRAFTSEDRDGAPLVCIINDALAKRLFPNESPLGKVLLRGRDADVSVRIVGVIGNLRSLGLAAPVPDEIYYPLRQIPKPALNITARTAGDPAALQTAIRNAVAGADPNQAISFFQSLDTLLSQSLGVQRLVAFLTGCFAVIALVLAVIGLYSVVAYAVAQRTGELGIRMALGARPSQVLSLVMKGGLKLVAVGVVIGLAGAAGAARLIATLLNNVKPLDPVVYLVAATVFSLVAAAACFLPSLRASRIDPLIALSGRRAR